MQSSTVCEALASVVLPGQRFVEHEEVTLTPSLLAVFEGFFKICHELFFHHFQLELVSAINNFMLLATLLIHHKFVDYFSVIFLFPSIFIFPGTISWYVLSLQQYFFGNSNLIETCPFILFPGLTTYCVFIWSKLSCGSLKFFCACECTKFVLSTESFSAIIIFLTVVVQHYHSDHNPMYPIALHSRGFVFKTFILHTNVVCQMFVHHATSPLVSCPWSTTPSWWVLWRRESQVSAPWDSACKLSLKALVEKNLKIFDPILAADLFSLHVCACLHEVCMYLLVKHACLQCQYPTSQSRLAFSLLLPKCWLLQGNRSRAFLFADNFLLLKYNSRIAGKYMHKQCHSPCMTPWHQFLQAM